MRRLRIALSVILGVLLGFAAMAWAGEASYFDEAINRIVRVCVTDGQAVIGVNNTDGTADTAFNVSCDGGNPANPVNIGATITGDVSLAVDATTGTAYVFYNSSGTPATCVIGPSGGSPYSISGQVTIGTSGLSNVKMDLTGASTATVYTNASGNYTFSGLDAGAYTITPTLANYTFTPTSKDVTITNANVTGQNFTATGGGGSCSVDVRITSTSFSPYPANNVVWNLSVTVVNQGSAASGPFIVRGYWSADNVIGPFNTYIPKTDQLLFTWNVTGLSAGQSVSNTFPVSFRGYPIHYDYSLIVKAGSYLDAYYLGDISGDCDLDNNVRTTTVHITR